MWPRQEGALPEQVHVHAFRRMCEFHLMRDYSAPYAVMASGQQITVLKNNGEVLCSISSPGPDAAEPLRLDAVLMAQMDGYVWITSALESLALAVRNVCRL